MKSQKSLWLVLITLILSINCYSENNENSIESSNSQNSQIVYICTGNYAYAYHSRSDCPGLGNCKGEIKYTDEYTAVNNLGRVPCCRCWTNVTGRCKDDNPYYGGGGGYGDNSEAYAYLALAIVAASAFILSNDIYIYPTLSFYNPQYFGSNNNLLGTGWTFGLRKKFKYSALEYGASYINHNYYNRWGGHLNYVHNIFYNSTPYWMRVYVGPTVNYIYNFGYGGLVGVQMKIFDRLRFDIRYELTTQTNQIQAGLIFTYQKKYFWEKK